MVEVIFYEKPGCINNTRQKKLLTQAGHIVDCRNLLTEQWDKYRLKKYFNEQPVKEWFNYSAPDIKSGKVDPSKLTQEEALEQMISNPLLIRRPLMNVEEEFRVGFDTQLVDEWIGLDSITGNEELEACPRTSGHSCDVTD